MDFFPKVWYNAPKAPAARRENERKRIHMADERNGGLLPEGQDTMMVYINPELIQTLADVSAKKEQSFRELLEAAEEGDLDAQ